ncbi:MAG: hypothetical protein AMS16_02470 [Planctomycetes bacterium DG_58]|nr:MAG: hypothetical protein AMS16_02470 [Planctomycetes bacterium DG_58]
MAVLHVSRRRRCSVPLRLPGVTLAFVCGMLIGGHPCGAEVLCDFEHGLDGWRETGDIKLTTVPGRAPEARALQVDFVNDSDNWRLAGKAVKEGLAGANGLSFWIRGAGARPVTAELYLTVKAGGQYRTVVLATPHWRQLTVPFSAMRRWGAKSELDAATVSGIFLRPFGFRQRIFLDDVAFEVMRPVPPKPPEVSFSIDAGRTDGKLPEFWAGFNQIDWGSLTRDYPRFFRDQIRGSGIRDLGIRHIRVGGFFSDGNAPWDRNKPPFVAVYRGHEDAKPLYDFNQVNQVMDYVVTERKLTPLVNLGFMPDALARPGAKNIGYGAGKRSLPTDWKIWDALIRDTARHLIERYGADEVRKWKFEVWNEPDLFHIFWFRKDGAPTYNDSDVAAYCELYDHTAEALKSVDPGLKVGGAATAGYRDFMDLWVRHCMEETNHVTGKVGSPVDFFSFHVYGPANLFAHKWRCVDACRERYPALKGVPVIASEYGPGDRGGDLFRSYAAAEFLRTVHLVQELRGKGDEYTPIYYHGITVGGFAVAPDRWSFGMYLTQGTQLYPSSINSAYRLMKRWGDQRLVVEGSRLGDRVAAIASKNERRVAVAIYHVDAARRDQGGNPAVVKFALKNLEGRSKVLLYRIDHQHHDLYSFWDKTLKRPEGEKRQWEPLSDGLAERLRTRGKLAPSPVPADWAVRNDTLKGTLEVPTNGVAFVFVEKPQP